MKSENAKSAIERFRKEFMGIYASDEVTEFCRLFGEIAEIAEQEAEEKLTRWNDPKVMLPERSRDVLIKLQYEEDAEPSYTVGYWNGQWFGDILGADAEIIGWREIHE